MLTNNNIHSHAHRESVSGTTTLGGWGTIAKKFEPAGDPSVARIPPVTIRVTKHALPQQHSRAKDVANSQLSRSTGHVTPVTLLGLL